MRNLFFLMLISMACSTKQEIDISRIISQKLDSLNLIQTEQIYKLQTKHHNAIDSINTLLSMEKIRTAADLNLWDFENYIKHHCNIPNDSIRILGAERNGRYEGEHVMTFMDYNLYSRFHDILQKGYRFSYNKIDSLSSLNKNLKNGHWLTIKKYNKYDYTFFYGMCDFTSRGFTISDSLFVTYENMEETGGSIVKINSISSFDGLVNINDAKIILTPTEDNPYIYVWNNKGRKKFITHESNLNKFPIIVKDCHDFGTNSQVNFIEPE